MPFFKNICWLLVVILMLLLLLGCFFSFMVIFAEGEGTLGAPWLGWLAGLFYILCYPVCVLFWALFPNKGLLLIGMPPAFFIYALALERLLFYFKKRRKVNSH